ncbi:endocuticle structural glycoprotein SgAbd-9-like [Drosophila novamexicana]|uniref:endocuticle structural glycoprotein SgAbd-9-like n=1 Tax=Drosophila novamexicana TaxID=47314 RepID=UPI0011E5CA00|nr:endocuticle structural glycoprotein SgAbd-9-like [Drosophila novamexicana]
MTTPKLILFVALVAVMAASCSAGFLDYVFPTLMSEYYNQVPTKEGYRFNLKDPNGSSREEIGVIMNPGTPEEQLVVMGTYSTYDEKTDTDTITMYTADKDGYKTRYQIKNRKLSGGNLKSLAG